MNPPASDGNGVANVPLKMGFLLYPLVSGIQFSIQYHITQTPNSSALQLR